ncbi:MAG: ABC transporter ATP-binding protein [bacterium]
MIRLDALTRHFDDLVAVDALSFEVKKGELFGLVGPDGAGKTTTLRMLAGVLAPTSGDAVLDGTSVAKDPEAVKHHLAYMSQRFGLYTDLTVLENLHFYADLYRVPPKERDSRLKRLFEFSNLGPFQDRLAGNLSGGMKQKLGLSCALIHRPDILLLDEPTFGVDPVSRRELWIIVHEMVAEGVTALVSTAYMDEAERFDRLALIHRGKLLALDTPDTLRGSVDGEMREIRVAKPRAAKDVAARVAGVRHATVFGDRIHVTLSGADVAPQLEAALTQAGVAPLASRVIEPSLEDAFVNRITEAETA